MATALPVWFALQEELLAQSETANLDSPSCFDVFDDDNLFEFFHLSRPCIDFITDTIRVRMKKKVDIKKPMLPVDGLLMVTLNYYAHGSHSKTVLQALGVNHLECPAIVSIVSGVIAGMSDQFITFPQNSDARADVASKMERLCGIPAVLGVLIGAHFRIRVSPYEDYFKSFVNSIGYTSVVSQIICDSDGNILSVEKCCAGSTSEQEVWESSFKGKEIEDDVHGSYWVIGGRSYLLSKHVLTPVSEPADEKEIRFNEAHAKIHHVMQATICSMKRRFRCLMQLGFAQQGSLDKKSNIIKACSVLHNIAKKFSIPPPPNGDKIEPLLRGKQLCMSKEISPEALKARQEVIDKHFAISASEQDRMSDSITEEEMHEDN